MNSVIRKFLKVIVFLVFLELIFRCGGTILTIVQGVINEVKLLDSQIVHRKLEEGNAVRIVCVGDSLTGWSTYPEKLEEILNKRQHTKHYIVFKKGTPSATISQVRSLIPQLVDKFQPDIVVLMIGLGDQLNMNGNKQHPLSLAFEVLHDLFLRTKRIFGLKSLQNSADLSAKNPPIDPEYQYIQNFLRFHHVRLVACQYPMMDIELLKNQFPSKDGIIFVDNRKIFIDAGAQENYFSLFYDHLTEDFGHLTSKGEELLSEHIAEAILNTSPVQQ